jgi:hypothetical protein
MYITICTMSNIFWEYERITPKTTMTINITPNITVLEISCFGDEMEVINAPIIPPIKKNIP